MNSLFAECQTPSQRLLPPVRQTGTVGIFVAILAVLAFLTPGVQSFADGGAWKEKGGSAHDCGIACPGADGGWGDDLPDVVVSLNGSIFAAYAQHRPSDIGSQFRVHVKKFDPDTNTWNELGDPVDGICADLADGEDRRCLNPSIALDLDGNPAVAFEFWFRDENHVLRTRVLVRHWSPEIQTWAGFGQSGTLGIQQSDDAAIVLSKGGALAFDTVGNPHALWIEKYNVYMKYWNGSEWLELGGSATGEGIAHPGTHGTIRLDPVTNRPKVAWRHETFAPFPPTDIYYKEWNGSAWVELGGSASGKGVSQVPGDESAAHSPSLAMDETGNPAIAWEQREYKSGSEYVAFTYVRRWDGTAWVEMAGSGTGTGISGSSLVHHEGWWDRVVSIAIDGSGNPTVAWQTALTEPNTTYAPYAKRFDPGTQSWMELAGSATGTGIGDVPSGWPTKPIVVLDSNGNPVAIWTQQIVNSNQGGRIYLKVFNPAGQ